MNEERLRTCINLFNSCESLEEYLKSVIAMALLIDSNDVDRMLTDLNSNKRNSETEAVKKLHNLISNNKRINVDEIQKMIISLSALFISLHKESILEKDMSDKSLTLLVNGIDYDNIITYIAQEKNNKYYITNIEFDTSLECLDFVRNKLLHGDYHIKEDHICMQKDGQVGNISYQRLIDFCFNLPKLRNCKDKTYTTKQVMLSPFTGLAGYPKNPLAERLFETTLTIRVKGKRKINSNMIELLDLITDEAFTLNIKKKIPVGEAIEIAIKIHEAELANLKCVVEYKSDFYLKNPIARSVLEKLTQQVKLTKDPSIYSDEDYLNFISTNSYTENFDHMHHYILGLTELALLMTPTAAAGYVRPGLEIGEYSPLYNNSIPMCILKFYCYYNYGLDAIFSGGVNTNLRDIIEGKNFDYSLLDLTLFDDTNMTADFKLNNYQDQLNALIQEQTKMAQVYNSKLAKYNAFKSSAAGSNQVAEQKILAGLQTTKDHLDELNNLLNKANNFDLKRYEKNLNIINHLRNSIAHGHYSIDDSNPEEIYFVFDDIYQGVNTYHLKIKMSDFEKIFNYKTDIKGYLESLSSKYLSKPTDRVHYEDILLDSKYVYPSIISQWNTLVENTLDINNENEVQKLLFAHEIMREITLSSLYTKSLEQIAEATEKSFYNFMKYACAGFKNNEDMMIYGRNVSKSDYKDVLELVFTYCEAYTEYGYDILLQEEYLPRSDEDSILRNIFPEKSL